MMKERLPGDCRACTVGTRVQSVERVIKAMRENLSEPISLTEMARVAYFSPFHFNRVFRQITGIPPTQFLYALRLETAKQLLMTTERSVTDICFDVGYNSLGTFTSRFTQLVGLSPCRFRRLADRFQAFPDSLFQIKSSVALNGSALSSVSGEVRGPESSARVVFVGLFQAMIPQSRPVGGAILLKPGPYRISAIPDGYYNVFAAAFRPSEPLSYLLPDSSTMLVGVGDKLLALQRGVTNDCVNINLRPMRLTDPPILVALPSLFTDDLLRPNAAVF